MEETKQIIDFIVPSILEFPTYLVTCCTLMHNLQLKRAQALYTAIASRGMTVNEWETKVLRATQSNNWLKLHGYRMRRRVH